MMQERILVGDTETTGFSINDGHKMVEIAFVELIDRKVTGNTFHQYIDPGFEIPEGAVGVHGLTREAVVKAGGGQKFPDICDDMLDFIGQDTVVFHNAPFDISFLDHELVQAGRRPISGTNTVYDTLKTAKYHYPNSRTTLDALAKRFSIETDRELHGGLKDSLILANVYLNLTTLQNDLTQQAESNASFANKSYPQPEKFYNRFNLKAISLDGP